MKGWKHVLVVVLGIAITTAGHYLTPLDMRLWHELFQRLYYLPVVYAAIAFGWVGGLAAGIVSGLLYLPHILHAWSMEHHYAFEQYAEIFMFIAVGIMTGILADLERRRRLELQETAAKLQQVHKELQDTFEQVKRADRLSAIGQLAAGLVHEIRNPIASIDGAAEVMEATDRPDELRAETMSIIRKECARMNRLLTGLLDFAKPRNPEWREIDVKTLLRNVIDLMKHSAPRTVEIEADLDGDLPKLNGDEEQLAQVMLNLTINAVQAMPEGGHLRLRASGKEDGVLIQISDEGVGVAAEDLERIFDPFYTTKDTGTGLGLSVAHQIVRQHGGGITVEKNAGAGMTFNVLLPTSPRIAA